MTKKTRRRIDAGMKAKIALEALRGIAGRQFWLWRAVDDEGEVLDLLVQPRRDKAVAEKLIRKLLKKQGFAPDVLVTDKLRSYGAAKSQMGLSARRSGVVRSDDDRHNARVAKSARAEWGRPHQSQHHWGSDAQTTVTAVNQALSAVTNYAALIGATQDRMTTANTFNTALMTKYANGVSGMVART